VRPYSWRCEGRRDPVSPGRAVRSAAAVTLPARWVSRIPSADHRARYRPLSWRDLPRRSS